MSRKSLIRALFAAALVVPFLSACGGSVLDPNPNCIHDPETMQYVCYDE